MRFLIATLLLVSSLGVSIAAQAWGQYGNPYGNSSNSPQVYSPSGQYRGNLNDNPYDSNSVSNPYGRYGSQYSSDSINNPYGASNFGNISPSVPAINNFRR